MNPTFPDVSLALFPANAVAADHHMIEPPRDSATAVANPDESSATEYYGKKSIFRG